MKKLTVSYTAVYPSNAFDLVEVLLNVTGNNIEAFEKLLDLRDAYPGFYNWYYRKVKQDIKKKRNGRVMLIAISDVKIDGITVKQLTGIAILKNTNREKKICTFRVFPKYREQGIGSMLLNICFKYLGTTKPLISISSLSRDAFTHIIEKYKWELYETLPDFYQKGVTEYVFNGFLSNNDHRKKLIFRTNKEVL